MGPGESWPFCTPRRPRGPRDRTRLRPRSMHSNCRVARRPRIVAIVESNGPIPFYRRKPDQLGHRQNQHSIVCGSLNTLTWDLATSSVSTITVRLRQKLRPVRGDSALSSIERHAASLYLFSQIILHTIFDLEVTVVERHRIRSAFRPDISQPICSSKLEGHQMIQFAHLVFPGICARLPYSVPLIGDMLLRFAHLAVADAGRSPCRIPQNLSRDRSIDPSRRTASIGNRIAVAHLCAARVLRWRLPLLKVA